MMDLKKQDIDTLKNLLNAAMEQGKVQQVDMILKEIMMREDIPVKKSMPEGFSERIMQMAEQASKKENSETENTVAQRRHTDASTMGRTVKTSLKGKSRKKLTILAATLIMLLGLGTAAYASGILFAEHPVNEDNSRVFPFSQEEPEYKAARAYSEHIDQTRIDCYYDPYEHPIYLDEEKVADLCGKYGLSYAKEKQPLRSMKEIQARLKNMGLERFLPEDVLAEIRHTLNLQNRENGKEEPVDYAVNAADYILDDGTISLTWGIYESEGPFFYDMVIMPKGTFPYMGRMYEYSIFPLDKAKDAYTCTSKNGTRFYCIPLSDGYFAVTAAGDKTIAIIMRGSWDETAFYKQYRDFKKVYDEKAKKELGLSGIDELIRKADAWRDAAMEQDLKALNAADQAFELSGDDTGLKMLQKQYSSCSRKLQDMYSAYTKEYEEIKRACTYSVTQKTFEKFLDKLGKF